MKYAVAAMSACLLMLIMASSAFSSSNAKLYKSYEFGMLKSEIQENLRIYDCSEEFEKGSLCLNGQKIAGIDVEIAFRFLNNKLVNVVLITEFTYESYFQLAGLLNSKFQLVTIESGDKKIDFFVLAKKYKTSVCLKRISDFEEQALASGNITYTFVEEDAFKSLKKSSDNIQDFIVKADSNIRVVEYIIYEVDENTAVVLIQFSAPKKAIQLLQKKSKQEYEDF